MMTTIDPTRLSEVREMRGLKQAELARRAGVDKQTIYRLEHEKKPRRSAVLERVTKALDIEVGVLTGEKPIPEIATDPNAPAEEAAYQLNVRVDAAVRNAFELAARRYRISVSKIAQLAPLLFAIVAEMTLENRGKKLEACRAKREKFSGAASELPYLDIALYEDNFDEFAAEVSSIAEKDVFGRRLWKGTPPDDMNPFVIGLQALAAGCASDEVTIKAVGPTSVDYRVCRPAAVALAQPDEELADSLLDGKVLIHRMPRGLTLEQRVASIREDKALAVEIENENPEEVPEEIPPYHSDALDIDL